MGQDANQRKRAALATYANKEYTAAIPMLSYSFVETQDSMLLFYKAVSLLAIGKSVEVQPLFEQFQYSDAYPVFRDASQWYLALAYTDTQQYEKASILLKNMPPGRYKEKAQQLFQKILEKK